MFVFNNICLGIFGAWLAKLLINPVEVTLDKYRPDKAVVPCNNNRPGENENFQQSFGLPDSV